LLQLRVHFAEGADHLSEELEVDHLVFDLIVLDRHAVLAARGVVLYTDLCVGRLVEVDLA